MAEQVFQMIGVKGYVRLIFCNQFYDNTVSTPKNVELSKFCLAL
jgi:hypothetical protein